MLSALSITHTPSKAIVSPPGTMRLHIPQTLIALAALATLTSASPDQDTHVVTVTVGPVIPTNEPEWKSDTKFASAVLSASNLYRREHNASALRWNVSLESYAVGYLRANDCVFEHSGGPYGENLAIGYENATASVEAWGDERVDYDFEDGEYSEKTGHFTQLVWRDTRTVGCGRRLCGEKGWYLVCEYWPRGNVIGEFVAEVLPEEDGDGGGDGDGDDDSWGMVLRPRIGVVVGLVLGVVLFWI